LDENICAATGKEVPQVQFVNNLDFYSKMSALDFIGGLGKHFRVNQMIAKDSVKSRLANEDGISYTEFSY
jgi:tyrosyl-tRNA synthetase